MPNGGIDAGIYSNLGKGAGAGIDFADLVRLKAQIDQQKASREVQQFELQRAMNADGRQNVLRDQLSQGGTPMEMQRRLLQGGFIDEAGKIGDQNVKLQSTDMARQKQSIEMMKQGATAVLANPSEQNAIGIIGRLEQLTGTNMDSERAAVYGLKGDPNAIKQWAAGHALEASQLLPKFEKMDLGGTVQQHVLNPVTGLPEQPATVRNKTMTPDAIASNAVARGHLDVARQRLTLDQGKADRERVGQQLDMKAAAEAEASRLERTRVNLQSIDSTLNKLDQILGSGGKKGMVNRGSAGIIGKLSSVIPETPGFELEKKIDSVKAALGFDTLQQMREASPTGGALGQVAVKELEFLQAKVASLDVGQGPAQLTEHLQEIQDHYKKWRAAVEKSASTQQPQAQRQAPAQPQSEQFDSMPDPAQFAGRKIKSDDGTIYQSNGNKWMRAK